MRRVAAVLLGLMIFWLPVVQAEIKIYHDKFTNGKEFVSQYKESKYHDAIQFNKLIDGLDIKYYFDFFNKVYDRQKGYSKVAVEIKIDDNPVQYLDVKNIKMEDYDNEFFVECTTVELPDEMIQQMLSAKRVAIKVYKENQAPGIIILPDDVLAEWKEVINTTK